MNRPIKLLVEYANLGPARGRGGAVGNSLWSESFANPMPISQTLRAEQTPAACLSPPSGVQRRSVSWQRPSYSLISEKTTNDLNDIYRKCCALWWAAAAVA